MEYEMIIGLEVHVELSTKTKIFCGCSTAFEGEPNSHTCPVCLGMPGSLPVLNKEAVRKAIKAGLALDCDIQKNIQFDRKNYFYPDLPKAYQISQLYQPLCRNGYLDIDLGNATKRITLNEIHMEEDAGKLLHNSEGTLIDYNRAGVPLIEIVTNPDFRSPQEVVAFLEKLREILVFLDISDCKMQEGSMRADVNLSVRPKGQKELGTRTEMKNLNSFKAIYRAIEFESERQINLLKSGGIIEQETRRWDDQTGESEAMRSKENAQDYRYFPDPDLLPIEISEEWITEIKNLITELPEEKRARYKKQYGLSDDAVKTLTSSKEIASLFEETVVISGEPKETANVITGSILRFMNENNILPENLSIDSKKLTSIIQMVAQKKINRSVGKTLVEELLINDIDPEQYVKEKALLLFQDTDVLKSTVLKVLEENPQSIEDYKKGKDKALDFLMGQCMRALKGKANPQEIRLLLEEKIKE